MCFPEERMKDFVKKATLEIIDTDYSDKNDAYYMKIMAALESIPICGQEPAPEEPIEENGKQQSSYQGYQSVEKKKKGGGRRPTARNMFIGKCMRKPENNGMGLDMSTCSAKWRNMNDAERATYEP